MPAPIRILHIDDNPLDAELVAMALEIEQARLQTTTRYVQTRDEYLAALDNKDFDLILSDYRMGAYDGDQALAAAREKCPDIPFIMVTGELGEEMVIETLKRGATDYVLKDRIFRLVPAIERALAERETQRKRLKAEEEARKAHREAIEVLESVQDPFYALDRDWRLTYVNSKAEAVLGVPRSELLGRTLWEAFPQAIGTKSHEMLVKAMQQRAGQHFETHSDVITSWIEVHVFPKADGGLSVLYRDISERKAQEEALRLSEERFAKAFRASPDPHVMSRLKDGTILDVNEAFLALFGYTREEVVGQTSLLLGMFVHPEDRERALTLLRQQGKIRHFETRIRSRLGDERVVLLSSELLELRGEPALLTIMHDVTEQLKAREALRQSEQRVRRKLESILSPEGSLENLELADLVDTPALQKLLDKFHAITHLPIGVIDVKGNVLVGIGWQDICTDYHRVHPETCRHCVESDTMLSIGVPKGEFRLYKCRNNLWDIATPIIVGDHHVGNLFSGQFFFEEEAVDREFFRAQARQYGFNEEEYLAALDRVPRFSRSAVEHGMEFLQNLADTISQLGYSNVRLARLVAERDRLTRSLHDEQDTLKAAQEMAHLGSWELDLTSYTLTWSDEVYRIFGLAPQEFGATYAAFLEHVHPEDRSVVDEAYSGSLRENRDSYEVEHRVVRKRTGEIRVVHERCRHIRDGSGKIVRSVGVVLDITERKKAEREREQLIAQLRKRAAEFADEEHRRTKEHLEIILRGASDGFIIYDAEFRFAYIGANSAERFRQGGWDPDRLIGRVLWEEFPGLVGSGSLAKMQEAMRGRVVLTIEAVYEGRWYSTRCVPTSDGGLAVLSIDITERKQSEEAVREAALFPEENPSPVLRVSREGTLLYANHASSEILERFGFRVRDPVSGPLFRWIKEAFEQGQLQTFDFPLGQTVFSFQAVPIIIRGYANLYGRNVTEQREVEKRLRQLNEDLRQRNLELEAERLKWQELIEGIADEVWACDREGRVSLLSLNQLRGGGARVDDDVLQRVLGDFEVLRPDGSIRPDDESPLQRSLRGEVVRGEEHVRLRSTGEIRIRQHSSVPVRDIREGIVGAVAIVRDVTEARHAEEKIRRLNEELEGRVKQRTAALERANQDLEAFSYMVSHDLKAPLRAISGFAGLLVSSLGEDAARLTPEKQRDYIELILSGAEQMGKLIESLLTFARAQRQVLQMVRVNMLQLAEEVISEQRQALGEVAARVRVHVHTMPQEAHGDRVLLKQVYANLISNAFKFSRKCEAPEIHIGGYQRDGQLVYFVRDNGAGFPSEKAQDLFQAFRRLHAQADFEGNGIGLANVRKIVERHGGEVCAEGEEGKGATFFFALPARV